MPYLRVHMLGPFQVFRQDRLLPNDAWPGQKSKSLFKILLTQKGHFLSTDQLIEYLWPDLPPEKALNNLWVTVSQLRRVLQPDLPPRRPSDYIHKVQEGYSFNQAGDFWLDVDAFESAHSAESGGSASARMHALEEAQALYRGDFLEEDPYEDWAGQPRDRLREDYLDLLGELADLYAQAREYRQAIQTCERALAADRTREAMYARLMLYHSALGERSTALKIYEKCAAILLDELGVDPSPETSALYRQIQQAGPEAALPGTLDRVPAPSHHLTTFQGRVKEIEELIAYLNQLEHSTGRIVLIEGEPGIGKSRLVQELSALAHKRSVLVLQGSCYQIEQTTPFQLVADLVSQAISTLPTLELLNLPASALGEIAALVPEIANRVPGISVLPGGLDEARQARLFNALIQFFTALALHGGLLLNLDDIHWADNASLRFVHLLARHIQEQPVFILCTYREEELATNENLNLFVQGVKRETRSAVLRLNRLSLDSVLAMLAPLAGSRGDAEVLSRWLHRETDGNPFFMVTILQSFIDQGLLAGAQAGSIPLELLGQPENQIDLALPDALRESVRSRLHHLSKESRHVVEMAAVLRRRFEFSTLRSVLQAEPSTLLELLEDLLQRRILRENEDGRHYDFSHDKIREVVYADLSSARRVYLHRTAAQALEGILVSSLDEYAGSLAEHFEQGRAWSKAVAYLGRAAARSRALFAIREAIRFYDRAIAILMRDAHTIPEDELTRLREQRGEALVQAGEFQRAAIDLQDALDSVRRTGDPRRELGLLVSLGMLHRREDHLETATRCLEQALAISRAIGDERQAAETLYHLGTVTWSRGENHTAFRYHQEAFDIVQKLGADDLVAAAAIHGLGEFYWQLAQAGRAVELFHQSMEIAIRLGDKGLEDENLHNLGAIHTGMLKADYPLAQQYLQKALEISTEAHLNWHMPPSLFILALATGGLGDYQQGLALAQQAVTFSESLHSLRYLSVTLDFQGELYRDLNLLGEAETAHARGCKVAEECGATFWLPRLRANLVIDRLRQGRLDGQAELQNALDLCLAKGMEMHALHCLLGLVELALARGSFQAALEHADRLLELAAPEGLRELQARARLFRGEAQAALGEAPAAEEELRQALELATAIGKPRLLWEIHAACAHFYQAQHRRSEGKIHLEAVRGILRQLAANLKDPALRAGLPIK